MKFALIFPPQWDPRQPPLALPALAAVVKRHGHEVRAWDLNLALYRKLLEPADSGSIEDLLLKKYSDPAILGDPEQFGKISGLLQKTFCERYDPGENHQLFWDSLRSPLSANRSSDWKKAIESGGDFPFFHHLGDSLKEIKGWAPENIGISIISDTQILPALAMAAYFRNNIAGARIILGGDAMAYRRTLLAAQSWLFKVVDGICVADGEPVIEGICTGKKSGEIPNLAWFDGEVVHVPESVQGSDFSSGLNPDFSIFSPEKYLCPKIVMPVETSRGCHWGRCGFCIHPYGSSRTVTVFNEKPLSRVFEEIKSHVSAGFRHFFFIDEAISASRLRDLSEGIFSLRESVSWLCYSRLEERHTRENFDLARKAGCRKIYFGLETASDRLLRMYCKGTSSSGARKVLLKCSEAGISVHLFLMTGFPDETREDQEATISFLREVAPFLDPFGFSYDLFGLSAELETPLFLHPEKFGSKGIIFDRDNDLAYQFRVQPGDSERVSPVQFQEEVRDLFDRIFQERLGLRNLRLSQDSIHLLLLESKKSQ